MVMLGCDPPLRGDSPLIPALLELPGEWFKPELVINGDPSRLVSQLHPLTMRNEESSLHLKNVLGRQLNV